MLSLIIEVRVKPELRTAYVDAITTNSERSVRDEPGCLRFDVIENAADPNGLLLYEVYTDTAAFEAHQASSHYAQYKVVADKAIIGGLQISRGTLICSHSSQA